MNQPLFYPGAQTTEQRGHDQRPEEGRTIHRSEHPFPYTDLNEAIELARTVRALGGKGVDPNVLAKKSGHSDIRSGSFRLKLSAARIFGLTQRQGRFVALTSLGEDILDRHHERAARLMAFKKVPLYEKLLEKYRDRPLPADNVIEADMIQLGVSPKLPDRARPPFLRSAKQANIYDAATRRLTIPRDIAPISVDDPLPSGPESPVDVVEAQEPVASESPTEERALVVSAPAEPIGAAARERPKRMHPMISAIFESLPDVSDVHEPMTRKDHERWQQAFKIALEIAYDVAPDGEPSHGEG